MQKIMGFLSEIVKARRQRNNMFKVLGKKKPCQSKIPHPTKTHIKKGNKVKTFSNDAKLTILPASEKGCFDRREVITEGKLELW